MAGLLLALLLTTACSPASAASSTDTPAPPLPAVRPYCVPSDEGTIWTPPGADGDDGAVLTLGSGDRGVLLIPQSDGDICQWLDTGRRLAAREYQVALMNWAQPYDQCVTTAYRRLRTAGSRRIALVGASMGGAYALYLAADLKPVAVASLSGR